MLSAGFTLRGLRQFLPILGPHESAIDDCLTVVFERHDRPSERDFLFAVRPS
jgi:hypothetical protein